MSNTDQAVRRDRRVSPPISADTADKIRATGNELERAEEAFRAAEEAHRLAVIAALENDGASVKAAAELSIRTTRTVQKWWNQYRGLPA